MPVEADLLSCSKSFQLASNNIVEALKKDAVSLIAVWGMAGVGKTPLVNKVMENVKETGRFDQVIKVDVGRAPELEKIQDGIAGFLKFKIKNTEMRRAEELRLRLKNEKKILIILDDVWDGLSLKDIGIPYGEYHKGCKVLLATRCENVCISMRVQKVIRLDVLSSGDAHDLFRKKADDLSGQPQPAINDAAIKVVELCQYLTMGILELGEELRGKSLSVGQITSLEALYRECPEASKNIHESIRLSYNHLTKRTTKLCFLLCSLFPQDYAIDVEVLTRYAWGLELFEGIDSIKKVRCEVWAAIENLISSCLLMNNGETSIKMHNLVRYSALLIATEENLSNLTGAKIGLKEWPKVEDLGEGQLEILSIEGIDCATTPTSIIKNMASLKVFTLRAGHFSSSALENLTNLRTLHLVSCQLGYISSLGKLEKLEILSFSGSDISELPEEIGGLNYLRLLDLSDCQKLQKVPLDLIRGLSQLEELYVSYKEYISCKELWFEKRSGEGSEAKQFETSIISSCYFPPKMETYEIAITENESTPRILRVTVMSLPRDERCSINKEDNPTLIHSSTTQLDCIWQWPMDRVLLQSLKFATIKGCHKLTSLFSFPHAERMVHLEKLEIDGCRGLKQIITDEYPLCLPRLTTLKIKNCNSLEYVFQITKASFIPQLSVLEISSCPKLVQVVQAPQCSLSLNENESAKLRQFQRLALIKLENLDTFCAGKFSIELPSLEELEVKECPKWSICEILIRSQVKDLRLFKVEKQQYEKINLLQGKYFISSLENLILMEISNLQFIWPNQIGTQQNLSRLEVFKCNELENIFSEQLARNLPLLRYLKVEGCEKLGQVVSGDGISSSLMAGLKPVYFLNLEEICITKCDKLRSLFPLSASRLPNLKKLQVDGASNLREIFRRDSEANIARNEKRKEILFPKLEELFFEDLPKLIGFTAVGYDFKFPALVKLWVKDCLRITIFRFNDDLENSYVRAEIEQSSLTENGNVEDEIQRGKENIDWDRHPKKHALGVKESEPPTSSLPSPSKKVGLLLDKKPTEMLANGGMSSLGELCTIEGLESAVKTLEHSGIPPTENGSKLLQPMTRTTTKSPHLQTQRQQYDAFKSDSIKRRDVGMRMEVGSKFFNEFESKDKWLDNTHIDAYMCSLAKRRDKGDMSTYAKSCCILDTTFYELVKCVKKKPDSTYELKDNICEYVSGYKPHWATPWWEVNNVLLVSNAPSQSHWVAMRIDLQKWKIHIYNSLSTVPVPEIEVENFRKVLPHIMWKAGYFEQIKAQSRLDEFGVSVESVPQQSDAVSCGMFAVAFIELLLKGEEVVDNFTQEDIHRKRRDAAFQIFVNGAPIDDDNDKQEK